MNDHCAPVDPDGTETTRLDIEIEGTSHPAGTLGGLWGFTITPLDSDVPTLTVTAFEPSVEVTLSNGRYNAQGYRMTVSGMIIGSVPFVQFTVDNGGTVVLSAT